MKQMKHWSQRSWLAGKDLVLGGIEIAQLDRSFDHEVG
jgi:hypothetical protein